MINLDNHEVKSKYSELKTIKAVASYFNVSNSTMERYFRHHEITYTKIHKNRFNEAFFDKESPESFYWAGFIAADGNISKSKYKIKIELSEKDIDHLNKFKNLIRFDGNLLCRTVMNSVRNDKWKNTNNYSITLSSKQTVHDLKKFNIVPNKTKIYIFPEFLIEHPFVHDFMRGYFDGDGHIGLRNEKKLRFHLSGNFSFLEKYQHILERECHIHKNDIFVRSNKLACLEYSGNLICKKIYDFLYKDSLCHLTRKYNVYENWKINYER